MLHQTQNLMKEKKGHTYLRPAMRSMSSEGTISCCKYENNKVFSEKFQKVKIKREGNREKRRETIVVSIPACHAGDPGSIPGNGVYFFAFIVFLSPIHSLGYKS
ncbi:hypothetical protein N665_0237s0078 [Sinapis alba]|nr:hypothetical protein N665_0237s0078 [Sinapis alba]